VSGARIFISYSREDESYARKLYDQLKAQIEFDPWLDKENLLPGTEWQPAILDAIEESQFFILLLSRKSVEKTGFIQREIREAIERFQYHAPGSSFLIPARLEPCEPRHRQLRSLQWVDLYPDWDTGVKLIIRSLLDAVLKNVDERFERLRGCLSMYAHQRQQWVDENGDALSKIPASTILRYLEGDEMWNFLANEQCALECMIQIALSRNHDALQAYVFRTLELAGSMEYDHERPNGYGIALKAVGLVAPVTQTVFLREMYSTIVSRFESSGAWYADLCRAEVAKHYSVRLSGMRESSERVVEQASKSITWDIPFLELWTFHLQHKNEHRRLLGLIPIIKEGLQHAGGGDSLDIPRPDRVIDLTWSDKEALENSLGFSRRAGRAFADRKVHLSRVGLVLRIGEYLSRVDADDVAAYGNTLSQMALLELRALAPGVSQTLSECSKQDMANLIRAIEYQDNEGLKSHFPDAKERAIAAELVIECSYYYDWTSGRLEHVKIVPEEQIRDYHRNRTE
jgi:hypothetical protein